MFGLYEGILMIHRDRETGESSRFLVMRCPCGCGTWIGDDYLDLPANVCQSYEEARASNPKGWTLTVLLLPNRRVSAA